MRKRRRKKHLYLISRIAVLAVPQFPPTIGRKVRREGRRKTLSPREEAALDGGTTGQATGDELRAEDRARRRSFQLSFRQTSKRKIRLDSRRNDRLPGLALRRSDGISFQIDAVALGGVLVHVVWQDVQDRAQGRPRQRATWTRPAKGRRTDSAFAPAPSSLSSTSSPAFWLRRNSTLPVVRDPGGGKDLVVSHKVPKTRQPVRLGSWQTPCTGCRWLFWTVESAKTCFSYRSAIVPFFDRTMQTDFFDRHQHGQQLAGKPCSILCLGVLCGGTDRGVEAGDGIPGCLGEMPLTGCPPKNYDPPTEQSRLGVATICWKRWLCRRLFSFLD